MIGLQIGTWILAGASLIGTVLNVKKVRWCFYIWTVTNALWLAYDIYVGLYSRAVLDFVYLGLAIYGIVEWKKKDGNGSGKHNGKRRTRL